MTRPIKIVSTILAAGLALSAAPAVAQHAGHAGHGDVPAGLESLAPETREIAEHELDQVRAATARYQDHANAEEDGYRRFEPGPGDPLMGEHWFRANRVREELDLTRPSTLIYAVVDSERRLVAVAYTVYQKPDLPLPEGFAGDADRWHTHDIAQLAGIMLADRPVVRWIVQNRLEHGVLGRRAGETDLVMLHAWIGMENPDGVFANHNVALPYARAGLPIAWTDGEPAARGVALLQPGACESHVSILDKMAGIDGEQQAAVRGACEESAAAVAKARIVAMEEKDTGSADAAEALNAIASRAWLSYAGTVTRTLTGEQGRRLAALRAATTH